MKGNSAHPLFWLAATTMMLGQGMASANASGTGDITWNRPTSGDVFSPGDMIAGEWTSAKPLTSPSFSLCSESKGAADRDSNSNNSVGSDDCGTAVWPTITRDGETYSITLAVPNVTEQSDFYLKLKDDFGNIFYSPDFTLSPQPSDKQSTQEPVTPEGSDSDVPDTPPGNSSGPLSDATATGSVGASSPVTAHPGTNTTSQVSVHAGTSSSSSNLPTHAGANHTAAPFQTVAPDPAPGDAFNTRPINEATNPHAAAPMVAIAIPLSLVAATLAASLALCMHHRRSLNKQKERNAAFLSRSSSIRSGHSTASSVDIEKAISALSASTYDFAPAIGYYGCPPSNPVPREDVRRERMNIYNSNHSTAGRRFARSPSQSYGTSPVFPPEFQRKLLFEDHRRDSDNESTVTDEVLSNYLQPSPLPTPMPLYAQSYLDLPQQPEPSHSRPQAPNLTKPLPLSPSPNRSSIYDAVARAVGGTPGCGV